MNTNFPNKLLGMGLTYDDVILVPQYSEIKSRDDVDTSITFAGKIKLQVPIVIASMTSITTSKLCIKMSELGGIAFVQQFQSKELQAQMLKEIKDKNAIVGASIGSTGDFLERAKILIESGVDVIVLDSPHAHTSFMVEAVKQFRKAFGDFPLLAGTIATAEAAEDLIKAGVDGLKVGIGAGGACLTRVNAGAGVPQITAIFNIREITKKYGKTLMADGGIKKPGDLAKSIGAGSDCIMAGTIFAGTDEAAGEMIEVNGKKFKKYFGDASEEAKKVRLEKDPNYRKNSTNYVEGDSGYVPYSGSLGSVVQRFAMGLRSAMSYSGTRTISEFQEKAQFLQVTQNGVNEAGAHAIFKF
jgi:IMP dehydrogenase